VTSFSTAAIFLATLGLGLSPIGAAEPIQRLHICGDGFAPSPLPARKRGDDGCQGACHARCPREQHLCDDEDDRG
jgi:hypothetical protein